MHILEGDNMLILVSDFPLASFDFFNNSIM